MIRIGRLVFAVLLLAIAMAMGVTVAADNQAATVLRDRAIDRIDAYIQHFRRTFERDALGHELDQAERELHQSVRLFRAGGQRGETAFSLVKLGDLQRYRDEWEASIRTYKEAVRLARAANAPGPECKALLGQARSYIYGKGAPGPAAVLIEQALPLAADLDDRSYLFDALDLRSQVQIIQGDLFAAADSLNRALVLSGLIEDDELLFYGYLDRADMYQKLAEKCDYQRVFEPCLEAVEHAGKDYRQALAIAQKLGWTGLAEQVQGFLRRLSIRREMIRGQRRLHRIVTESGLFAPEKPGDVLVNQQFTVGENPQLAGLLAWIEREGGLPPATDARGAYVQGLLREMSGAGDEALEWYLRAVERLEQDRRFLHEEKTRGGFLEDKIEFYYTAMLHLLDRGRYPEAFKTMEQSRSRAMADLLATKEQEMEFSTSMERELFAAALELRSRIAQLQTRLFELRNAVDRPTQMAANGDFASARPDSQRGRVIVAADAAIIELERQLRSLENEHDAVSERIRRQSPRLARLVISEPVSLQELQRILAKDRSDLLAYLILESQLVIWHVGPRSVQVRSVFLPRSELKRKIQVLRDSLTDPAQTFNEAVAHELFLFLIEPVLKELETERLVIVPHEDLNYLPFQVLLANQKFKLFLGEQFRLSYAPSATVMASLPAPKPLVGHRLLAVADPSLAQAPAEVRAVGDRYPGRVVADTLPTETQLKSWMKGRDLVHLAVHGRFVADEPLLSHLYLARGNGDDGRLTAAEMYGLPLDAARLVVLSACETGTVRATHANEVLGMTRGLLFAGADALLLSAWKIDDEATADWMRAFYQTAAHAPPAEAARQAIKYMRGKPAYQHPFYWSPFLLIGR